MPIYIQRKDVWWRIGKSFEHGKYASSAMEEGGVYSHTYVAGKLRM